MANNNTATITSGKVMAAAGCFGWSLIAYLLAMEISRDYAHFLAPAINSDLVEKFNNFSHN
jgi:hypothetical protein